MRLTSLVSPTAFPHAPSPELDKAVMHLDWAHEAAGSAVSDPDYTEFETLVSASRDAATAAELLDSIQQPLAAEQDAERAIHDAFTAIGMDGRGE